MAFEDAAEPAAIVCDITGLAPLWSGGEQAIASAACDWATAERLEVVTAVASTIGLAVAAARYASPDTRAVLVASEQSRDFAAKLPIEALRVDSEVTEGLQRVGIESIGQLMKLPRASLASRFGEELTVRLDQLVGDAQEPFESLRANPPAVATWEFESAVSCPRTLESVRGRLFERLLARSIQRRCGVLRVLVEHHLDAGDAPPVCVALRLFRPTASARELAELANLHLDGVRFSCAVRAIAIRIGAIAPIEARQRTLFEDHRQADPHTLALLINRLASRVGVERVMRVQKRPSVDARRGYASAPATDVAAEPFSLTPLQAQKARRLPVCMPAKTVPIVIETSGHGDPLRLRWRGVRDVARFWGPERIETGWWRGQGVRHDAWWVELNDGARLWLLHDLRCHQWSLAGVF